MQPMNKILESSTQCTCDLGRANAINSTAALGHLQPAVYNCNDRLLCEVYRSFKDVSAVTRTLNGGYCS